MSDAILTRTHIDKSHDPEGVRHRGGADLILIGTLGDVVSKPVLQRVWGKRRVGGQVPFLETAVLRQEGISHQGADQRSQAYEEMQGLRRNKSKKMETTIIFHRGQLQRIKSDSRHIHLLATFFPRQQTVSSADSGAFRKSPIFDWKNFPEIHHLLLLLVTVNYGCASL